MFAVLVSGEGMEDLDYFSSGSQKVPAVPSQFLCWDPACSSTSTLFVGLRARFAGWCPGEENRALLDVC